MKRVTIPMLAVATALAAGSLAASPLYSQLVVLGDSLSDTGNLFAATGERFPPSPPYARGLSNGPLWPQRLANDLGVPLNNFAVAGATTGTSNVNDGVLPGSPFGGLHNQLGAYSAEFDPQALHMIWAGSNNFLSLPADPVAAVETAISDIASVIAAIAGSGATHVAIANLPDLALTPRINTLDPTTRAGAALLSQGFNQALDTALTGLTSAFNVELIRLDVFGLVNSVVTDPAAFGFTNVSDACLTVTGPCQSPDDYLFWDDIHPSAAAHRILAQQFRATIVSEPSAGWLMILASAALMISLMIRAFAMQRDERRMSMQDGPPMPTPVAPPCS